MSNRARRKNKPSRCGAFHLALLFFLLVSLIIVFITTDGTGSGISTAQTDPRSSKTSHFVVTSTSTQSVPSVTFINGAEIIWQIPDSPKAILFIAHGCNCRPANFWDQSTACPHCVGLPEDRLIVLKALDRQFVVLAVSSLGRCWSMKKDGRNVKGIIEWWIQQHKLQRLPVTALGASSGGYFVSELATDMNFSSIALMISAGVFGSKGVPVGYPPTLFAHMPKDQRIKGLIEVNMAEMRKKGVHVKEVGCTELPLTPSFFSDRIPGLDQALSVMLFELFQAKGFVDDKGYLKDDGRATPWKQALIERERSLEKYELLDHIQEELNLAFAYHEMTSLPIVDILDWFDSHLGLLAAKWSENARDWISM